MRKKQRGLILFLFSVLITMLIISEGFASTSKCGATTAEELPRGKAKAALEVPHFPDRLHTFVWRNWESVSLERMAEVLDTTAKNISEIGYSMGLPTHVPPNSDYQQRGYISIIRRNWHLLSYEQLLTLLGWDAERLAFTLQEDDFLFIKLGNMKPVCPELRYVRSDESAKKRCAEIRAIVSSHFSDEFIKPSQRRFDFVRPLSTVDKKKVIQPVSTKNNEPIRFLYSYFGVYGDPLLNLELDPYPEGLLQKLAELGVNGVWLHTVLRQLAPSSIFPEFGDNCELRLANLRKMVDSAKRYGIKIYLYMNEPRAMPESFFKGREHLRGIRRAEQYTLCTSAPEVRQWITESLSHVFREVPELGGVFTITASENLTNCYSKWNASGCPRCSKRSAAEVIAEVNTAIAAGVWQGNPNAKVIVWDWGWADKWVEPIIDALPDNVYLMSVSEWSKPIVRGGVASEVGEYSISAVGPGPRAQRHWSLAKKRGLKTIAKVQVNCSWELSAVPYLPVMNLVAQHCDNLTKAGIDGLMLSWTVGGSPSPNLRLAKQFNSRPAPTVQQALSELAIDRYGSDAAGDVLDAWSKFSTAFTEYPFHIGYVYRGPTQYGPANPLYAEPTGYSATMVGFPYDHVNGWRAAYPAEVLAGQFEKLAAGWKKGLAVFDRAMGKTKTAVQNKNTLDDLRIAEACYLHFKSVANQIRFTLARNALLSQSVSPAEKENHIAAIKEIAVDEIQIAKRLFVLTREDSRIGFEASNHYYYFPFDLVEKVINCEYILNNWLPQQTGKKTTLNNKQK